MVIFSLNHKQSDQLTNGQVISDRNLSLEIVSCEDLQNIKVKILSIDWDRLETYVDVGKEYRMFKHFGNGYSFSVWEIDPEGMKRCTSQLLMYWERNQGFTGFELDF